MLKMSEDNNETLEAMKTLSKSRFPEDKSVIDLISSDSEMVDYLKKKREIEEGETGDETENEGQQKPRMTIRHEHIIKKAVEDQIEGDSENNLEGGEDLSKTGGQIPLFPSTSKPQTWESHEAMLDDLFKLEMLGKIESTRQKPKREIIEKGERATEMIEKLYKSGMQSGRLTRAGKDLLRGRFTFKEPEWIRQLMNPKGRKRAKEKPALVESL